MRKIPKWIFMDSDTQEIYCARCLEREKPKLPMPISAFIKFNEYFGDRHQYCKEPLKGGIE